MQSWVPIPSSSSSSFHYAYMPAISSLRHARIAMILSSVFITLLPLRNNHIPLHQSSNFVWSLLNHPGSGTVLLDTMTCIFSFVGTGATDISLSDHLFVSSEALFVIFNNPSPSNIISILFVLYKLILSLHGLHYTCFICFSAVTLPNHLWTNHYVLFVFTR